MAKERGVFRIIWQSFVSSLKPRFRSRKLVGQDYYGTKYYEEEIRHSNRKRPPRYFIPINKDDFTQELPAEWESWLRYRRQEPPTQEEVEANYQLATTKKQNAATLEDKYSKNIDTEKLGIESGKKTPGNFPVYEDYKSYGDSHKPK